MIKSISLENWKSHYKTELEFEKGTNVIIGKMGSGKSSIMDAISFALYGTFPSLNMRKVSLDETIMNKPIKQETARIKLEFDYRGKEYEVTRIVKRKGINEASLKENGKTIAGPKTTEVTQKIGQILETNYDLFSRAIYSEQNQIDYFLRLSPSQRKEKFDELLGLDKYEKVRINSVTLSNRLKKMIEDRQKIIAEQKKKNNPEEIKEYEKRLSEKQKEHEEYNTKLGHAKNAEETKEKEYKELGKKSLEARKIREEKINAKSAVQMLEENIKKALEKLKDRTTEEITKEITALEKLLKGQQQKTVMLEKEIDETETVEQMLKEQLAVQKNILKTNNESSENTKKLGGECPVCKKNLSEHDREKLAKELLEEKQKIEKQVKELGEKAAKAGEILSGKKNAKKEAEKHANDADKKIHELRITLKEAEETKTRQKQLSEKQKLLEELSEKEKNNPFDEKELEATRKEYYSAREQKNIITTKIGSAKELIKELETGISRIKEAQKQVEEMEEQTKKMSKTLEALAIFTSALKATQAELRSLMIQAINEAMDQVWGKVYPYADFLSVKIMVADEGSYEIMVKQRNSEWVRVEGILSGGERSSAALTLRIAVSLVLTQNLGWIILDEPTHNLDVNAVRELSETMRTHLPELIEQIFVITHDRELENAASGKLYTLEREKEKDGAAKILG